MDHDLDDSSDSSSTTVHEVNTSPDNHDAPDKDDDSTHIAFNPLMDKVLIVPNPTDTETPFTRINRDKYIALDHLSESTHQVVASNQIPATPVTHGYTFESTPNYYEPLWIYHCDPDTPISDFDLDIRADEESLTQTSVIILGDNSPLTSAIQAVTITFNVESMSRTSLFQYVDSYLETKPPSDPEAFLCTIAAQPVYLSVHCFLAHMHVLTLEFINTLSIAFMVISLLRLLLPLPPSKMLKPYKRYPMLYWRYHPISKHALNTSHYGTFTFWLLPRPSILVISNCNIY